MSAAVVRRTPAPRNRLGLGARAHQLVIMLLCAAFALSMGVVPAHAGIDAAARGIAAKALKPSGWTKLTNASQAIHGRSPWDLPVNTSLATVTSPSAVPVGLTRGYAPFAAISANATGTTYSANVLKNVYLGIGGAQKNFNNNLGLRAVTGVTGNVGGTDVQNAAAIEVMADAAKVAFRFNRQGTTVFRVKVDGQYVTDGVQTFDTTFAGGTVVVDLGTRRVARISVEVGGAPFGGAWVGPTESLWKPQDEAVPNVAVLADSYGVKGGASFGHYTPPVVACVTLGWRCTPVALGGTGYINPGAEVKFADHLDDLTWQNFDAVIVAGGINDKDSTTSAITAAALATFQGIRARIGPNKPIIVFGPWLGSASTGLNSDGVRTIIVGVEDAINAAFIAWGDPNSEMIRTAAPPGDQPVFYGSGYVDVTTSDGNNDLYSISDRVHINDAGSIYAGRWMANVIRARLANHPAPISANDNLAPLAEIKAAA